ncbi:MAG: hypothetical protein M2R45_03144 [Verrucomicrobia subdivision 3 bacterium]|nr:hypothetical protein [Limisphaerales bacterium]MCS1413212.1 hypothetical protein [Limisphaerales bacterium]
MLLPATNDQMHFDCPLKTRNRPNHGNIGGEAANANKAANHICAFRYSKRLACKIDAVSA